MSNERKSLKELNLIDDFLFSEAMRYKDTAEIIVKLIVKRSLGLNIENIVIEPQKTINGIDTDRHGIRMDVSVSEVNIKEDKKEIVKVFDIEPNNLNNTNLPKRSRYYQAITDVKFLKSGEPYDNLPELFSIWILPYDPFGKNQIMYSVKNVVEGFENIYYNDGMRKIFLYTDGEEGGSEELKNLLQYIKSSNKQNAVDMELEKLNLSVEELKDNAEIGVRYMQAWEILYYEKKRSKEEGMQQVIIEQVCKKLKKGKTAEVIADELEESMDTIEQICEVAKKYAPDYDVEQICDSFYNSNTR